MTLLSNSSYSTNVWEMDVEESKRRVWWQEKECIRKSLMYCCCCNWSDLLLSQRLSLSIHPFWVTSCTSHAFQERGVMLTVLLFIPRLLYFELCCHPIRILLCISFLSKSASRWFVLLENETLLLFVVSLVVGLVVCLFFQVSSSSQHFFHPCIDWQFLLTWILLCIKNCFALLPLFLSASLVLWCEVKLFWPSLLSDADIKKRKEEKERREGKKREERGWRTTDIKRRKGMSEQKVERMHWKQYSEDLLQSDKRFSRQPPLHQMSVLLLLLQFNSHLKKNERQREREIERDWNQIESVCFHVRLESDLHPFYSCCFSLEASPCFVSHLLRQRHASLLSFFNNLSSPSDYWHDLHLILLSFFWNSFLWRNQRKERKFSLFTWCIFTWESSEGTGKRSRDPFIRLLFSFFFLLISEDTSLAALFLSTLFLVPKVHLNVDYNLFAFPPVNSILPSFP